MLIFQVIAGHNHISEPSGKRASNLNASGHVLEPARGILIALAYNGCTGFSISRPPTIKVMCR